MAVLCFNGCGEDAPQEFVAIDLHPEGNFQELWRDVSHDWGQFQLLRLFGTHIYKFDLLNNSIQTHNIRTYQKLHSIPLVEEMRYPHGEIAGDGKYLAIPGNVIFFRENNLEKVVFNLYFFILGKMSSDNSPAVCVWNVRRGTHKFLVPPQPFCPFRKLYVDYISCLFTTYQ